MTTQSTQQTVIAEPIDVVDGIPDRAQGRWSWRLILVGLAYVGWVVFLACLQVSGQK